MSSSEVISEVEAECWSEPMNVERGDGAIRRNFRFYSLNSKMT